MHDPRICIAQIKAVDTNAFVLPTTNIQTILLFSLSPACPQSREDGAKFCQGSNCRQFLSSPNLFQPLLSLSIFCSHRGEDGTRVSSDQGCNCRQFLSSSNLFRPLPASFVHITERPDGGKIFARSVGSSGEKSSSPNLFPSLFLPCPFVRNTECCQGSSSK